MKKVLVIVMLIFAFGCSDDATEPSENSIVGKWKTYVTVMEEDGQTYESLVVIEFGNDANYIIIVDDVPEELKYREEGKYSISGDIITVVNNECENIEGRYKFEFKDNGVEFMIIEDDCNRNHILSDFYYEFDAEIEK